MSLRGGEAAVGAVPAADVWKLSGPHARTGEERPYNMPRAAILTRFGDVFFRR